MNLALIEGVVAGLGASGMRPVLAPGPGEIIAFWLGRDGQVLAGMNVNVWDVSEAIQDLVRAAKPVDAGALRDAATPLESLAS